MRRLALGGPVMHREPFPFGTVLVSAALHLSFLGCLLIAGWLWRDAPPKVYVVNLVPAVAAVGAPQGRSEPARPPTPDPPLASSPPVKPAPTPPTEMPRKPAATDLPAPVAMPEPTALPPARHQLPPLPEPPQPEPAQREPATLPESPRRPQTSPIPAPPALPKAGEKELPTLAGPPPTPPPPTSRSVASTQPGPSMAPAAAPLPPPPPLGRPTGSPQGAGAITLDVSNFPFAWYLQQVQRKVNENWSPSVRGSTRAVIVFEIGRDGQVRRPPAVEEGSGNALYDQAALRAVTNASPFPPLPAEFKEPLLRIHLGFDFSERG